MWQHEIKIFPPFLLLSGFFVQPLKRWLSPNTLCMSGLILMALGLISSAYCKVFYALYFTYGILLGKCSFECDMGTYSTRSMNKV